MATNWRQSFLKVAYSLTLLRDGVLLVDVGHGTRLGIWISRLDRSGLIRHIRGDEGSEVEHTFLDLIDEAVPGPGDSIYLVWNLLCLLIIQLRNGDAHHGPDLVQGALQARQDCPRE